MGFDWQGRRVVVSGAGGFIGSHLTECLLEAGAEVAAMVHLGPGHLAGNTHPSLHSTAGDLREPDFARQCVEGADTVFHLGAVTSVAYSYAHPQETVATNTLGTAHMCAAARRAQVRRFVHTSTAGVYGDAQKGQALTEMHPIRAFNPYTAGKLGGDHVAEAYYRSYDLPVCTVRLFNVYGPRMGRYLVIPAIIGQLRQGPEVHLGDLRPTRPFVYIEDIVGAFLKMAAAENVVGEVVHFAGAQEVSIREVVERISALMGRVPSIVCDRGRLRPPKSEIFRVRADCAKAAGLLGWKPHISLDTGLRKTIDWFQDQENGK